MADEPPFPFDIPVEDAEWAVDQLLSIHTFLAMVRKYGFAVTATPQGRALLEASRHPEVAFVRDSVCPIEYDPWTRVRR